MRVNWAAAILALSLAMAGCGERRPEENRGAGGVETLTCEYVDCAKRSDAAGEDARIASRYIYFYRATVPTTEDEGVNVTDFVRRGYEPFPDEAVVPTLYAVAQETPTGLGGRLLEERPKESELGLLLWGVAIGVFFLVLIILVWVKEPQKTRADKVAAGCTTVLCLPFVALSVWFVSQWSPTEPVYKIWFDNAANAKVTIAIDGTKAARVTETARWLVPVQFPKEQGKTARLEVWDNSGDVLMESAVIAAPQYRGLIVYNIGEKNRYRIQKQRYMP